MPENLRTPEGAVLSDVPPVGVDEDAQKAFAQAMAAPEPGEPKMAAPPPRDPADPEAPFGRTKDGKPKKGPGGRPPRAERPRVTSAKPPQAGKDYTEPLHDLVRVSWGILAVTSPADAAALRIHGPGMVTAWNSLAQENSQIARGIEWLTSGSAYGAVVLATVPMVVQVLANHRVVPHERLGGLGIVDPAELAEATKADVGMMQEAAAAQAQAAA